MTGTIARLGLSGRNALVTGGSRGIGRAIVGALAEAGAAVAVHGAPTDADEVRQAAAALPAGFAVAVDLDAPGSAAALVRALPWAPDILVLNAAIEMRAPWTEASAADADRQLGFNLREQLALMQAVVPGMQARGWGRVLAIGSVQSARPHPDMMIYAATKAALVSMARNLARQVAADGVTVNVLSPGVIETQRNQAALSDAGYRAAVLRAIPAGRFGEPADCAGLALFLCSDAAAYVTGAEMRVDGGMSL